MKVLTYGEQAIVLQISYGSTAKCVYEVRSLFRAIYEAKGAVSVRPGLDCVVIEYEPGFDIDHLVARLSNTAHPADLGKIPETFILPVCYEGAYARDMASIEKLTGLEREEIIELHTAPLHEVWMIGFMPGFPYLGGLHSELKVSRKTDPDPHVPAGSVAIAEEFTGIYPFDSPGGWQIIGRTPRKLVNYNSRPPWLFDYGMGVRFQPISAEEFEHYQ
jgi:inhibitor of KinA